MTATHSAHAGLDAVRGSRWCRICATVTPGRLESDDRDDVRRSGAAEMHALVRRELQAGRQACVIYPLVERESEKIDVKAATEMADTLAGRRPPGVWWDFTAPRRIEEPTRERTDVMKAFARPARCWRCSMSGDGRPKSRYRRAQCTIMVVSEHARNWRPSLSQLHQLRGRVGRSSWASALMMLVYQAPMSPDAKAADGDGRHQ